MSRIVTAIWSSGAGAAVVLRIILCSILKRKNVFAPARSSSLPVIASFAATGHANHRRPLTRLARIVLGIAASAIFLMFTGPGRPFLRMFTDPGRETVRLREAASPIIVFQRIRVRSLPAVTSCANSPVDGMIVLTFGAVLHNLLLTAIIPIPARMSCFGTRAGYNQDTGRAVWSATIRRHIILTVTVHGRAGQRSMVHVSIFLIGIGRLVIMLLRSILILVNRLKIINGAMMWSVRISGGLTIVHIKNETSDVSTAGKTPATITR